MDNCFLCKFELIESDYVCCKMKCAHVLCQKCFHLKILNNIYKCEVCGIVTDNVISEIGHNLIKSTHIPKIGTCKIDEHYNQWMKIYNDLTKEKKEKNTLWIKNHSFLKLYHVPNLNIFNVML